MVSTLPNEQVIKQPHPVNQITPVSKYLALALFVMLPFIGAYVGFNMQGTQSTEIITVEKTPEINIDTVNKLSIDKNASSTSITIPKNDYLISARTEIFKGYHSKVLIPNDMVNGITDEDTVVTCDVFVIAEGDKSIFDNVLEGYKEFNTQNILPFAVVIKSDTEWPLMWKEVLENTTVSNQVYAGITNYIYNDGKGRDTCESTIEQFSPFKQS